MSLSARIQGLVSARLVGRKIDVVGFVDELLAVAQECGVIHCSLAGEDSLRFENPSEGVCEVKLDGGRGKLRMLCARLQVLCQEAGASLDSPYGGEGVIVRTSTSLPPNGNSAAGQTRQWSTCFRNTPDKQEFTIMPIKSSFAPSPALAEATVVPGSKR